MNSIEQSTKLVSMVKELSDIQSSEIELMLGIFRRNLRDITDSYIDKISKEICFKCEFYGKKIEDLEVIKKNSKKFQKVLKNNMLTLCLNYKKFS